ncbi:hypothetical protein EJB05_31228, partial [Eragrostis curvula]
MSAREYPMPSCVAFLKKGSGGQNGATAQKEFGNILWGRISNEEVGCCASMSFPFSQLNMALGRRERHLMEATPSGGEKSLRSPWPVQWLPCASANVFAFFHGRGKKELCTLMVADSCDLSQGQAACLSRVLLTHCSPTRA